MSRWWDERMDTIMKRHRHTPEQAVRKIREGERLLNEGSELVEVLRQLEVSKATWNRWRTQYGGMKADEATSTLGSSARRDAGTAARARSLRGPRRAEVCFPA